MTILADSVDDYISKIEDPEKRKAIIELRKVITKHLPEGFEEGISYNMIGYCVPHSIFPSGYHCDPKLPLPFMSVAAQKSFVAVYHMGIYADPALLDWFTNEHTKRSSTKLDMGKSCIRYKKPATIPLDLIGELASKMTTSDWIAKYQSAFRK